MTIRVVVQIKETFKSFVQSGNYELALLDLMNRSQKLFPHKYRHNVEQSKGQCDFIDLETGTKFDAKLPFDKQEGELICRRDSDIQRWLEYMMEEAAEFSQCLNQGRGIHNVGELKLYKSMAKRLRTVEIDENVIFFLPYPIVHEAEGMIYVRFATDILTAIYDELVNEKLIGDRNVYVVYPALDQNYVLRCLNTGGREFLCSAEITEHISYEFTSIGR